MTNTCLLGRPHCPQWASGAGHSLHSCFTHAPRLKRKRNGAGGGYLYRRSTMASVIYAMSGEGRGHATRARVVVEALRARHRLTLFASGHAYDLLVPRYRGSDVRVVRVPGLRFAYGAPGRVNIFRTLADAAAFRWRVGEHVERVLPEIERAQPD